MVLINMIMGLPLDRRGPWVAAAAAGRKAQGAGRSVFPAQTGHSPHSPPHRPNVQALPVGQKLCEVCDFWPDKPVAADPQRRQTAGAADPPLRLAPPCIPHLPRAIV